MARRTPTRRLIALALSCVAVLGLLATGLSGDRTEDYEAWVVVEQLEDEDVDELVCVVRGSARHTGTSRVVAAPVLPGSTPRSVTLHPAWMGRESPHPMEAPTPSDRLLGLAPKHGPPTT
jgi:hypothetical protein